MVICLCIQVALSVEMSNIDLSIVHIFNYNFTHLCKPLRALFVHRFYIVSQACNLYRRSLLDVSVLSLCITV